MRRILGDIGDCLNRIDLDLKTESLQVLWGKHWREDEKVAFHVAQRGGGKVLFAEVEELQALGEIIEKRGSTEAAQRFRSGQGDKTFWRHSKALLEASWAS